MRIAELSIAEAKPRFADLVHQAEASQPLRITRRRRAVAVLLPETDHVRLNAGVLRALAREEAACAISAPSHSELVSGCRRLPHGARQTWLLRWLEGLPSQLPVLPFDAAAAPWLGSERARLAKAGRPLPRTEVRNRRRGQDQRLDAGHPQHPGLRRLGWWRGGELAPLMPVLRDPHGHRSPRAAQLASWSGRPAQCEALKAGAAQFGPRIEMRVGKGDFARIVWLAGLLCARTTRKSRRRPSGPARPPRPGPAVIHRWRSRHG